MAQATATKPTGKAHRIAASIPAKATDSTVANLDNKATTASATASTSGALKTGKAWTGQGLYDKLIGNDKTEKTNMELVRDLVSRVDTASFKALLKDFVGVAQGYLDNAEKEHGKESPLLLPLRGRLKTAQNHQSVLRVAYGAIKFASDQLETLGYTSETGYQTMRVIGAKALELAGLKWDGSKAEEPAARKARIEKNAETQAIAEVMANTPRNDGESRGDYLNRVDKLVEETRARQQAEAHADAVKKLADKVIAMSGSMLAEVIAAVEKAAIEAETQQPALH